MEMGMEMEWIDGMGQLGLVGLLQIVTSSPAALESQLGSKAGQLVTPKQIPLKISDSIILLIKPQRNKNKAFRDLEGFH